MHPNTILAKTAHYHTKFEEDKFYHIYNRTIDKQPMFRNEGNYSFFLKRYDEYLSPVVDTYAYCLLGNHFHLLVRVRNLQDLTNFYSKDLTICPNKDLTTFQKLSNLTDDPQDLSTFEKLTNLNTPEKLTEINIHNLVSHQFRKFFQSYAMAFNKQHGRIGTLFQTPFKRALIDNDAYFLQMVYYIHANPTHHGIVDDFRNWKWSSYQRILIDNLTKLKKAEVVEWFGSKAQFLSYHNKLQQLLDYKDIAMEDE